MMICTDRVIIECPVCSAVNFTPMRGYEKDSLVRCCACSFVFSGIRPEKAELDAVYGAYDYEHAAPTGLTIAKINELAARLMKLRDLENVLDIACGSGTHLMEFKKRGCSVYGTEYDASLEDVGRKKGIQMLPGGILPSKPVAVEGFDLVIFTEIIEHINNPKEVLANICELLGPGGLLYITTPNFDGVERRLLGPAWGMICYPEHISYYNPRSLHAVLNESGFVKVDLYTENISIFRVVQRFQKKRTRSGKADAEGISARVQAMTAQGWAGRSIKAAANWLLRATGSGTSLVAVYRKKAA